MRLTTVPQEKHTEISEMVTMLISYLMSWQNLHMALRCVSVYEEEDSGEVPCVQGWRLEAREGFGVTRESRKPALEPKGFLELDRGTQLTGDTRAKAPQLLEGQNKTKQNP